MAKTKTTAAKADKPAAPAPIPDLQTRPAGPEVTRADGASETPPPPPPAPAPDAEPEAEPDAEAGDGEDTEDNAEGGADPRFNPPPYPDDDGANTAEYRVLGPIFEEGRGYQKDSFITLTTERARAIGANLLEGPLPR